MQLPYRLGVGITLINRDGLVWAGQRLPDCARDDAAGTWQMPQGRIEPDEPVRGAALNVLQSQVGVQNVQVLAEAPGWFSYELPAGLIGKALDGQFCGQRQKWLAVRYLGDDSEIDIAPGDDQRRVFVAWRWMPASQLPQLAVSMKRELYEDVIATFAPFVSMSLAPMISISRKPAPSLQPAALPWFVTLGK